MIRWRAVVAAGIRDHTLLLTLEFVRFSPALMLSCAGLWAHRMHGESNLRAVPLDRARQLVQPSRRGHAPSAEQDLQTTVGRGGPPKY